MSNGKFIHYSVIADTDWYIWQDENEKYDRYAVQRAILLDIRGELRKLNAVLACRNFQSIPTKLERIARNTAKRKPKVKK